MPTLNIPEEKVPQRRRSDRPESNRWGNQPRGWFPGLAAAAAIVIALFVIDPESEAWGLVYLVSFLAALAVMLGGTLSTPPRVRPIWWLLLAFIALTMAAQALAQWQEKNGITTFPSIADAVFLAAYVPAIVALAMLIPRLHPGSDRETWIDSTIVTFAPVSSMSCLLLGPICCARAWHACCQRIVS